MNYFKTTTPVGETRAFIKSIKVHEYEYCILSMRDKSVIVISNSASLTSQLHALPAQFAELKMLKREFEKIHQLQLYITSKGNLSLLMDTFQL